MKKYLWLVFLLVSSGCLLPLWAETALPLPGGSPLVSAPESVEAPPPAVTKTAARAL